MNKLGHQTPESLTQTRTRMTCGVGLLLCLVFYVLSYPFGYEAARRFPSPVDDAVRSGLTTLYIPIDLAMDANQSVYSFYDWYLATAYETFPVYFEMPLLLPIRSGEHAPPIQIDPPL